jgi:hypothetical protein
MVGDIHIHRTDLLAGPAVVALLRIHPHPKQGEIAHRLQKHGDRTEILTKRPVVLEDIRQGDSRDIIDLLRN